MSRGSSPAAVCSLLAAGASLVAEHGLGGGGAGFSCCGLGAQWLQLSGHRAQTQWPCCWGLAALRRVSSQLARVFFAVEPPGEASKCSLGNSDFQA